MSETGEVVDEFEGPPEEEKRIPLRTSGDVERELGKVYRAMRKRRIPISDGNGLVNALIGIAKVMKDRSEDEAMRRLEAMERKRGAAPELPSAN